MAVHLFVARYRVWSADFSFFFPYAKTKTGTSCGGTSVQDKIQSLERRVFANGKKIEGKNWKQLPHKERQHISHGHFCFVFLCGHFVHPQKFHSRDCRAAGCVAIATALLPHVLLNLFFFKFVFCKSSSAFSTWLCESIFFKRKCVCVALAAALLPHVRVHVFF